MERERCPAQGEQLGGPNLERGVECKVRALRRDGMDIISIAKPRGCAVGVGRRNRCAAIVLAQVERGEFSERELLDRWLTRG